MSFEVEDLEQIWDQVVVSDLQVADDLVSRAIDRCLIEIAADDDNWDEYRVLAIDSLVWLAHEIGLIQGTGRLAQQLFDKVRGIYSAQPGRLPSGRIISSAVRLADAYWFVCDPVSASAVLTTVRELIELSGALGSPDELLALESRESSMNFMAGAKEVSWMPVRRSDQSITFVETHLSEPDTSAGESTREDVARDISALQWHETPSLWNYRSAVNVAYGDSLKSKQLKSSGQIDSAIQYETDLGEYLQAVMEWFPNGLRTRYFAAEGDIAVGRWCRDRDRLSESNRFLTSGQARTSELLIARPALPLFSFADWQFKSDIAALRGAQGEFREAEDLAMEAASVAKALHKMSPVYAHAPCLQGIAYRTAHLAARYLGNKSKARHYLETAVPLFEEASIQNTNDQLSTFLLRESKARLRLLRVGLPRLANGSAIWAL